MNNALLRLSLAALLCLTGTTHAEEIKLAVAANFAGPIRMIAERFQQESGHKMLVSLGSTGKFYAQIANGAPFEMLLAADDETPTRLAREGLGRKESQFTYAIGKLVLWSPKSDAVDPQGQVLKQGRFEKLAIADPRLAPYGAAAIQTMTRLGLLENLRPKLVTAENIAQAYQFVASGNASLGFVAYSQIVKDGKPAGSWWEVPATLHDPIRQDAIILKPGFDKGAVAQFAQYLRTEQARSIIREFGYSVQPSR
jgi:molybdate transport system substrate-binding protein